MPRTPEEEHARGQKDFVETKDNFLGPSLRTPWCGAFESAEDHEKRTAAYIAGFENAAKQEDEK
jgi:hypothetical protein